MIATKTLFVALLLLVMTPLYLFAEEIKPGSISGQFFISKDHPMAEGLVYIYDLNKGPVPSQTAYWRIPNRSHALDGEGRFSFQLPPGEYCVAAIKRREGPTKFGPPLEGDYLIIALDEKMAPQRYLVKSGKKFDIGAISGASPYKVLPLQKGMTAISGVVQDSDGKPVKGGFVFAFATPNVAGKPLFVSDPTSDEGRFVLRVHGEGTYYLKLRGSIGGGAPRDGALIDGDKDEPLQKVTLKDGEILTGVKMLGKPFAGRGRKNKESDIPFPTPMGGPQ